MPYKDLVEKLRLGMINDSPLSRKIQKNISFIITYYNCETSKRTKDLYLLQKQLRFEA